MTGRRRARVVASLMLVSALAACDDSPAPRTAAPEVSSRETPGASLRRDGGCERSDFDLGDVGRFYRPRMRNRGGRTILRLAFLDGSRARLSVPSELDVAGRGIAVDASGSVGDFGRTLWIWHARLDQLLVAFGCPRLLHSYEGSRGVVGLWHFPTDVEVDYLGFPFGAWTVLVYDYSSASEASDAHMTHDVRRAWVTHLRGRVTRDGFLVLDDSGPLELADATTTLYGRDGRIVLTRRRCDPARSRAGSEWCLGGRVGVVAVGSDEFARALRRSLTLDAFVPARR